MAGVLLAGSVRGWAQSAAWILPRRPVLVSGETLQLTARGPGEAARGWRWGVLEAGGGAVGPDTGRYHAPEVAEPAVFHLRATASSDPAIQGEVAVTVLPRALFARGGNPGPGGGEPLPFLLPGGGRRYPAPTLVQPWCPGERLGAPPGITIGYGLPAALGWESPAAAEGERLTFFEGGRARCLDVTGQGSAVFTFHGRVTGGALEALRRGSGCSPAWKSLVRHLDIGVRGMMPFAGEPAACPSLEGGPGPGARFRALAGVAVLGGGLHCPTRLVVADTAGHRLCALTREGEDDGGWGRDGEPGFRDGPPGRARFNQPAFLAVDRWFPKPEPWPFSLAFLVSDSGNHVIRKVDAEGTVTTLAGVPGQGGCRDAADPRQALFQQPQGLVMDEEGTVFVADRGNHVIRRIAREGPVTTLAGLAGAAGSQDGEGPQARFGSLAGLALAGDGHLYAADGHALRRITRDGRVTTVLGVPDRPGFRDDWERGRADLAGVPCLREPWGVCAAWKRLYLADRGNHAVREFDLGTGTLRTLAGDPQRPGAVPGLLRDGLEGALGPGYAGLEAPGGLAVCERGDLYVATGSCLMRVCRERLPRDGPPVLGLEVAQASARPKETVPVRFWVPNPAGPGEPGQPVRFVLEFVHADGTVAERREGSGFTDRWLGCQGAFARSGAGTVRLRCLTDQGYSYGAHRTLPVRDR